MAPAPGLGAAAREAPASRAAQAAPRLPAAAAAAAAAAARRRRGAAARAAADGGGDLAHADFTSARLAVEALEEYAALMAQPQPDVLLGATLIARHRHPRASHGAAVEVLDDLAEQVLPRLDTVYPLRLVRALSAHLHGDRGFRGSDDFYDPDNSCVNAVLERRSGIPLTLSLVYMEVAARCGVELHGVNLPGRFLLTPADPELEFFVDAFELGAGGGVRTVVEVEETLGAIYGREVRVDAAFARRAAPLPARTLLARMCNNLQAIYASRGDYAAALAMSSYQRLTRPDDVEELRAQGLLLFHMGRHAEAAAALREYLDRAPADSADVAQVQRVLALMREMRGPGG